MYELRQARLSVWYTLKTFFEDAMLWSPPYTVYGLDDMALAESALATRPYIFILDGRKLFETQHLPLIVVDMGFADAAMELGGDDWLACAVGLHIFGRNAAERDDIAGAIRKHIKSIALRDFEDSSRPVVDTRQLEQSWAFSYPDLTTKLAVEATLAQWITMASAFLIPA